jgi:hypothetical protein
VDVITAGLAASFLRIIFVAQRFSRGLSLLKVLSLLSTLRSESCLVIYGTPTSYNIILTLSVPTFLILLLS